MRNLVITGGVTGIGYAIAKTFVAAGDAVGITGRRGEVLHAAAERLGARPARFDASDPAVERGGREVVAFLKTELLAERPPLTHGGVIGQIWRGGAGEQAVTARLLPGVHVEAVDELAGRRAGVLLGRTRLADVIDAAVVPLATDGDAILTADADDVAELARAADLHLEIVPV
jgi:NAD(P)-dependent dehydrogenase (short-subunit alcohol dehydrogenase family)